MGVGESKRENSELYYTRIKILGNCLFLQSVLELEREGETVRETLRES